MKWKINASAERGDEMDDNRIYGEGVLRFRHLE